MKKLITLLTILFVYFTLPAQATIVVSQESFDTYCEKGRNRMAGRTKPMTHRRFKMTHR